MFDVGCWMFSLFIGELFVFVRSSPGKRTDELRMRIMGPVVFIGNKGEHRTSNTEHPKKLLSPAFCLAAPLLSSANAGSEDSNKFNRFLEKGINNIG